MSSGLLIDRITPLCQHYSAVVQFAESNIQLDAGRVNQALAGALYQLVKDYYIFVTQLETQHKLGELTLNKIWYDRVLYTCYWFIKHQVLNLQVLHPTDAAGDEDAGRVMSDHRKAWLPRRPHSQPLTSAVV